MWRAQQALAADAASDHLFHGLMALRERGRLAGYAFLADKAHRLPRVGPAFGTKFLTLSAEPGPTAPLILDSVVAEWIERHSAVRLNPTPWSLRTYTRYLELIDAWAADLGATPGAIELCIFSDESTRRGNQWASGVT